LQYYAKALFQGYETALVPRRYNNRKKRVFAPKLLFYLCAYGDHKQRWLSNILRKSDGSAQCGHLS